MAFSVSFSADAERDLELIFDFLVDSYVHFGETVDTAISRAEARVRSIRMGAEENLVRRPHRGTLHDLSPGLRHVTLDRAIFWFDLDETSEEVRVLGVFFGGQDHHRRMLARLLGAARKERE